MPHWVRRSKTLITDPSPSACRLAPGSASSSPYLNDNHKTNSPNQETWKCPVSNNAHVLIIANFSMSRVHRTRRICTDVLFSRLAPSDRIANRLCDGVPWQECTVSWQRMLTLHAQILAGTFWDRAFQANSIPSKLRINSKLRVAMGLRRGGESMLKRSQKDCEAAQ